MPRMGWTTLGLVVALLAYGQAALGTTQLSITGSGVVESKAVSASAVFEVTGDNKLKITLTNLGTASNYTPAQVLAGIAFELALPPGGGFDASASAVELASGSTLYSSRVASTAPTLPSVSPEWALATGVTLVAANGSGNLSPLGFAVTATSFETSGGGKNANSLTLFPGADMGGGNKLGGSDFGLLNEESRWNNPFKKSDIIVNSVVMTLTPNMEAALLDLSGLSDVKFFYGSALHAIDADAFVTPSESTGGVVPLPLGLALGLCGMGMVALGRRRAVVE